MAVIAKMYTTATKLFGDGAYQIGLSCVYDQGLAAEDNEDVRFTKASPWGAGEVTITPEGVVPQRAPTFYILFHKGADEPPCFDECDFAFKAQCVSVEDTGHTKKVKWTRYYKEDERIPEAKQVVQHFAAEMGIDNPGAYAQFEPSRCYFVSFYDASRVTLDEALRLARA